MSEMEARVAQAIWDAHKDNLHLRMTEVYPLMARAAIAAIKTEGEIITEEAWAAFALWIAEYDPEGEMDALDQATAYGKWCEQNESEK